jgi:hypothetical protein
MAFHQLDSPVPTGHTLKYFIHFIKIEIQALTGIDFSVTACPPVLPTCPLSEISTQIASAVERGYTHCALGYVRESDGHFVEVLRTQRSHSSRNAETLEISCFLHTAGGSEIPEHPANILTSMAENPAFVDLGDALRALHPSVGYYKKTKDRQSIAICTPCFRRQGVLRIYCAYMTKYFMPYLTWKGLDAHLVICGDEGDLADAHSYIGESDITYLVHRNNLGEKKNLMLEFARGGGFDYVTTIDSDDILHPETTLKLIQIADANTYWAAVEPFYFIDLASAKAGLFSGYSGGHDLAYWGMGSGRVFTKSALEVLGDTPFGNGSKGMDNYVKRTLKSLNIDPDDRLLRNDDIAANELPLPIGLKTEGGIWKFNDYATTPLPKDDPRIAWMPPETHEHISSIFNV